MRKLSHMQILVAAQMFSFDPIGTVAGSLGMRSGKDRPNSDRINMSPMELAHYRTLDKREQKAEMKRLRATYVK